MLNLAGSLRQSGCDVHLFALNTTKHHVDVSDLPAYLRSEFHFDCADIDTKVTFSGAFRNLFSSGSYNVQRFYSKQVEEKLIRILKNSTFDVIQLDTLFTTPYIETIRKYSKGKIVLRAHNSEHIIWERMAKLSSSPFKKWYLSFLAGRLKKYELEILSKVDAIVPITSIDAAVFKYSGYTGPLLNIPLGIDMKQYPLQEFNTDLSLFHLGSMDWLPNQEAIRWFLFSCWPSVHNKFPALRLYLAGRAFPADLLAMRIPGVSMEGKVENASDFLSGKQIMIVPLLSGSGMRVKIIQGMAYGKTIISTSIGAEGIGATDGENILIADSPATFLEKIGYCLSNPEKCRQIGMNGRRFVGENYSNEVIGNKLHQFYSELCYENETAEV